MRKLASRSPVAFPLLFLLAFSFGALLGTSAAGAQEPRLAQDTEPGPSWCTADVTSTLRDASIPRCGRSDVTLSAQPSCRRCPNGIRVVFVQLIGAMELEWQHEQSAALYEHVLARSSGPKPEVGIVHYSQQVNDTFLRMTDDPQRIRSRIANTPRGAAGMGQIANAAESAVRLLEQARRAAGDETAGPCEFVVLFSYFKISTDQRDLALQAARTIHRSGASLLVGCPANAIERFCRAPREMALSPDDYTAFDEQHRFHDMVDRHLRSRAFPAEIERIELTQRLPAALAFLPGSVRVAPAQLPSIPVRSAGPQGEELRWDWDVSGQPAAPVSLTYGIQARELGEPRLEGSLTLVLAGGERVPAPVPPITLSVQSDICPTPSPAPSSTATPSSSPMPRPTPRPTSTPSATAEPPLRPIFLPIALTEACDPTQVRIDVALVIDASSSMGEPASPGSAKTKLEAATAAVGSFLDLLALGAGDQATIVSFSSDAWLHSALTADRSALDAALASVEAGQQTRIDRGLEVATAALLDDARRDPDNEPVLVLLSDGRANPVPVEVAVERASEAKMRSINVFTIGLGDDVEAEALREMASEPGFYLHAPTAADLEGVYREVARSVPCPPGAFWGGRRSHAP